MNASESHGRHFVHVSCCNYSNPLPISRFINTGIRRQGVIRRRDLNDTKGKLRRRDFNKDLMEPFKKSVQDPWILVFKHARDENGNVFNQIRDEVEFRIRIVINEVCASTTDEKVRAQVQGKGMEETWMKEMISALRAIEKDARVALVERQREYSQEMSAKGWLVAGYEGAMANTGPGCMSVQKVRMAAIPSFVKGWTEN